MPEFKYFKQFDSPSLADGATYEDYWTSEEDVVIKRIFIASKDGTNLTKSTFWFEIPGRVFARPTVPARILGPDIRVNPELNLDFPKGAKINWVFKNLEGAAKTVDITFEIWSK